MNELARETLWFDELRTGEGAAVGLEPQLREALVLATVDHAADLARSARAAEQGRVAQVAVEAAASKQAQAADARRQREQHEAAARAAENVRSARRRSIDWSVLVASFGLCVTVLVPWQLGKQLSLRDTQFYPKNSLVFDIRARVDGEYFLSDWLSGCILILLLAALLIAIGSWKRRASTLVAAGVSAALSLTFLLPTSIGKWNEAEAATAASLSSTVFPFGTYFKTCGYQLVTLKDGEGKTHLWQIHTASAGNIGTDACNRLEVYDGWGPAGTVQLPAGESLVGATGYIDGTWDGQQVLGTKAGNSGIIATTSKDDLVGLVLSRRNVVWRSPGKGGATLISGATALVEHGVGKPGAYLEGINALNGSSLWRAGCLASDEYIREARIETDQGNKRTVHIACQGPGSFGDTGWRNYLVDVKGKVTKL